MKDRHQIKKEKRNRRHNRIRARVFGNAEKPRLCVFKSGKHIYAQIIDDEKEKTLFSASDLEIKKTRTEKSKEDLSEKNSVAFEVGRLIAKKTLAKKIEKIVFDRAGYNYHGNVKSLADGAREGGLKF